MLGNFVHWRIYGDNALVLSPRTSVIPSSPTAATTTISQQQHGDTGTDTEMDQRIEIPNIDVDAVIVDSIRDVV